MPLLCALQLVLAACRGCADFKTFPAGDEPVIANPEEAEAFRQQIEKVGSWM